MDVLLSWETEGDVLISRMVRNIFHYQLKHFIRDPHAFSRETRMPRYHFSDSESRDLVAYFESEFKDFGAPEGILD